MAQLDDTIRFRKMLEIVGYYRDLQNIIAKDGAALSNERPVFLIYGPSRSGKSALLGRLFSNISIPDYVKILDSKKRVKVPETDIEIGPEPTGVTTVANFRTVNRGSGDDLVIDLAGYGDSLEDRRPIVSILNKAVLSRIKCCRIILTVNVFAFSVAGRPLFENQYVKELVNLFTPEHYALALDSVSFVLTNTDKFGEILKKETGATSLEGAIRQSIMSMFVSFRAKNNVCVLLGNIADNFVAINYDVDDSTAAYNKIKTLLDAQKKPLRANNLIFSIANAGSEFNQLFTDVLGRSLSYLNQIEKELEDIYTGSKRLLETEFCASKTFLNELKTCKEGRETLQKQLIANSSTIANLNGQIEVLNKSIEDNELRSKDLQLKEKEFELELKSARSISVSAFLSNTKARAFGTPANSIDCFFVKPLGCITKHPHMIALSQDAFGTGEIVQLLTDTQSLQSASNLVNTGIYATNAAKTQAASEDDFHWEPVVNDTGVSIRATCKRPFALILINEINVKEGANVRAVFAFFRKQTEAICQSIKLSKTKLKTDQELLSTLSAINERNKIGISEADRDIRNLSTKISASRDKCNKANAEIPAFMSRKAVEITNKLAEPDIQESSKVVDILTSNNIRATFGDIFREIQKKGDLSNVVISRIQELGGLYSEYLALYDGNSSYSPTSNGTPVNVPPRPTRMANGRPSN